ncbi:MAG: arsenate reductase ArsC, partial [Pseudomonadota bacterium]
SAGSMPTGTPNPLSIKTLEAHHIPLTTGDGEGPRSKSWDVFAEADAPKMDFVITVCDNAAGEVCPIWPTPKGGAAPQKHHWSFPDPAAATGSEEEKLSVFETIFADIRQHIDHFIEKETT